MSTDPRPSSNRCGGFTLLEVALGVTILAVLAGTMFTIVQGSLQAAGEIRMVQRDNRRVERLVIALRETFRTLPAGATLELKVVERSPLVQELVLRGAPRAFVWGGRPLDPEPLTFAMRRYPEAMVAPESPEYYYALSRPSFFRPRPEEGLREVMMNASFTYPLGQRDIPILADDQSRYWLPILPAIRGVTWRFYETGKKRWVEESSAVLPPLVEMTLFPFERNTPVRVVFATQ